MEKETLNITCKDITMDVFIDCDCNRNYRRLHPTATDEELREAWGRITAEFSRLTGSSTHEYTFSLARQVAHLETKLACAAICTKLPSEKATPILEKLGYKGTEKVVKGLIKRDTILLRGYSEELKLLNSTPTKHSTENDYEQWMVAVSKYMGYRIDKTVCTVLEFISMDRLARMEAKANQKIKK